MNFLKIAAILLFIIVTVVTVKIRPGVHNPMIIEDADFKLTRISDTVKEIPVVSNPEQTKTVQNINITEPEIQKTTQQIVYNVPEQTQTKYVQSQNYQPKKQNINVTTNSNPTDKSQLEMLQNIIKNVEKNANITPQETPKQRIEEKPIELPKQTQPKTIEQPKVQEKVVQVQPKSSSNPYMTEEEEIIAWNVWRSNIHNQIMKDSDIGSAFVGTIFSFSFIVDKFGNVSNIKVEAFPPLFMDIARDGVKPAIARLQGKPILNFPRGTKRTSTVVEGKFAVGTVNRFSTPGEYSDYERVVR